MLGLDMFKKKGNKMQDTQAAIEVIELLTKENERLKQETELFRLQIQELKLIDNKHNDNVQQARDWAINRVEAGDLDFETANELGEILGFDVKQEFEVTIQVEYTFTVKAATNSDVEDIIDGLDLPTLSGEEIEEYRVYGELVDRSYTTV
jgi:hypothetical protein